MHGLDVQLYGVPLFFPFFLIGPEHQVTVNYERAGTESTTNFELPVDRLCSSLCHCDALPNPHIGTNPTHHHHCHRERRPPPTAVASKPSGKRDANELSATIVDRAHATRAMRGFLFTDVVRSRSSSLSLARIRAPTAISTRRD